MSADEVERRLVNLVIGSKGADPDEITPAALRNCVAVLAPHFAIFSNAILKSGIFP